MTSKSPFEIKWPLVGDDTLHMCIDIVVIDKSAEAQLEMFRPNVYHIKMMVKGQGVSMPCRFCVN